MDSDQELKSLKRGLKAMTLINTAGSITISELSRALDLPRTTAERVLMTLLSEGYVARDPQTKRYFLTTRVRGLSHGFVYNFWQDAANPKGLWRRTAIADYQTPDPKWELLLDVDALAKADKENWVFKGAECSPGEVRCLVRLSRGGGDAVVVREYDLKARKLADDGFALPEAREKSPLPPNFLVTSSILL